MLVIVSFFISTNQAVATEIINEPLQAEESTRYLVEQMINQAQEDPYASVEIEGDNFTILYSEESLLNAVNSPTIILSRANGINAIRGSLLSGNFSVYLTRNVLGTLQRTGASALSFLLGGGMGFVASTIYNLVIADQGFAHGRVFVFRGYYLHYWYYQ